MRVGFVGAKIEILAICVQQLNGNSKGRCQKHPEGGCAHNAAAFGRKCALPHFFLPLSILPPFFCISKYPPSIHLLVSSTLPPQLSPYVCDLPLFKFDASNIPILWKIPTSPIFWNKFTNISFLKPNSYILQLWNLKLILFLASPCQSLIIKFHIKV